MAGDEPPSQQRLYRIMTDNARAILTPSGSPYEAARQLQADLLPLFMEGVKFAAAAYEVWDCLTDAIHGPVRCSRGLSESEIEGLMQRAAREWLTLDPTPERLEQYFDRWREWPDSIWPGEFSRWSERDQLPPEVIRQEAEDKLNRYHSAIQRAASSVDTGWTPYAAAQKLQEIVGALRPEREPIPWWVGPLGELINEWDASAADRLDIERRIRQLISEVEGD